jgi:hypothetical protein
MTFPSCNKNTSEIDVYGDVFKNVVISEDGVFRTHNLGNAINEVLDKETTKPLEQDFNYLYYEYKIDSNITYNIKYTFDERGLNEIESDIFISNNIPIAEDAYTNFKKYFDDHYGQSQTQRGFNVWSIKSEKYSEVIISLGNELPAFDAKTNLSKISVWIYPGNN